MIKPLRAGTGALVTALMLTACTTSAHHESRPSVASCARAESAVREVALETAPFSGVTTSRGLAAAGRKLNALGRVIMAARKGLSRSVSYLINAPPLPPSLAREMRRVQADENAFSAAFAAYYRSRAGPQAIGNAAEKVMRDTQAIRATCSREHR